MKRLFVAIIIVVLALPISASLSLHDIYTQEHIYYTHNNHLGSAAWITEGGGKPMQYMHYLPYGQLLANQTPGWYDERFKFIGKERDEESGYDYFGARYYIAPFIHFISPDPHSDARPGISSYAYCSWDPVNRIDPDGRDDWSLDVNTGEFQKIGNKGGSTRDYYSVGIYEGEKFSSYSNYEIERGDGAINSFRIQETDKSTISAFHIPETNTSGFILERPGPDTSESGQSLRIPASQYGLHENQGSHYPGVPRLYLPNEVILTFQRPENSTTQKTTQKTEVKTTQKTTQKTARKTAQKILELIKQDNKITKVRLAELCGISYDGIKWQIDNMQTKGIIRRVGGDNGGHWEIIE